MFDVPKLWGGAAVAVAAWASLLAPNIAVCKYSEWLDPPRVGSGRAGSVKYWVVSVIARWVSGRFVGVAPAWIGKYFFGIFMNVDKAM